jgi:hypothetical protein
LAACFIGLEADMHEVIARATWSALLATASTLVFCTTVVAHGDWPEGTHKQWFQNLQRPDNDAHPYRKSDPKSLFCCGAADVVKTKFMVELGRDRYPDDVWYAWLNDTWTKIPPEKIVKDYAPDGQAYLFVLADTIQCFVRPKVGI